MMKQQALTAQSEQEREPLCWRIVHTIWQTRHTRGQLRSEVDEERVLKTTLRELVTYGCFVLLLTISALGMTSTTTFNYNMAMQRVFLDSPLPSSNRTFRNLKSVADFWEYLQSPLLNGLYYSGVVSNSNNSNNNSNSNISNSPPSEFILYESLLLSGARLRQLRVANGSCKVTPRFASLIAACFAAFSSGSASSESFGHGNAWRYRNGQELGGVGTSGRVARYSPGGFSLQLPARDPSHAQQQLESLFKETWINRGTRAVAVEFSLYNANVNLFCLVQLLAEMPPTGGLLTSWSFRSAKLLRYALPADLFIAACECVLLAFVAYYIVEELLEIKEHKLAYFKSAWNLLDVIVILISCLCAAFNICQIVEVKHKLPEMLENDSGFPDFQSLCKWQRMFDLAVAFAVFFAWVKLFKYFNFSRTMSQLFATLGNCSSCPWF